MNVTDFLAALEEVRSATRSYRLGGNGSDGTCDCIGAIIGAAERCGVRWPGTHGSNWAARNATENLTQIPDKSCLAPGDLVYKARLPGDSRYALPDRYNEHFDPHDYYHVGVVISPSPLRILHCTSPGGFKTDTKLGSWKFHGQLSLLDGKTTQHTGLARNLRYGLRGDDVARLQLLLRAQGYSLQPDGIFGPMTREAVRSYQAAEGLQVDGIVGPITWASLQGKEEKHG